MAHGIKIYLRKSLASNASRCRSVDDPMRNVLNLIFFNFATVGSRDNNTLGESIERIIVISRRKHRRYYMYIYFFFKRIKRL